jgi:hypothetical protein
MPNIDSVFPSHYLKASDLNGASPVVTISRLAVEPIGRNKEMKPVLYFVGKDKGLVLNKTNASKIAQLSGSKDTDDWAGVRIRLYATEVEFGGESVEAIRVRAATEQQAPKPQPVETPVEPEWVTENDIDF